MIVFKFVEVWIRICLCNKKSNLNILHKCQIIFLYSVPFLYFFLLWFPWTKRKPYYIHTLFNLKTNCVIQFQLFQGLFWKWNTYWNLRCYGRVESLIKYLYNNVQGLTILSHLVILKINKIILVFRPKSQVRNISWAEISDVFLAFLRSLINLLAWQVKYYKINIKMYLFAIITVRAKF